MRLAPELVKAAGPRLTTWVRVLRKVWTILEPAAGAPGLGSVVTDRLTCWGSAGGWLGSPREQDREFLISPVLQLTAT